MTLSVPAHSQTVNQNTISGVEPINESSQPGYCTRLMKTVAKNPMSTGFMILGFGSFCVTGNPFSALFPVGLAAVCSRHSSDGVHIPRPKPESKDIPSSPTPELGTTTSPKPLSGKAYCSEGGEDQTTFVCADGGRGESGWFPPDSTNSCAPLSNECPNECNEDSYLYIKDSRTKRIFPTTVTMGEFCRALEPTAIANYVRI